ncbi:Uncharacterised protein [Mycobacteroides abscessus subsp. abscessus]|nr:Uncharacterised protein [Mycobacteroides abscessus subsp. abscessus]
MNALNTDSIPDAGAAATTSCNRSSGAYAAAMCPAQSAACPPCEWPIDTQSLLSRDSSHRAARNMSSTECAAARPPRYSVCSAVPRPA